MNAYEDLEHTWSNLKMSDSSKWYLGAFFIETMASRGEFIEIKFEEIPSDQEAQELIRHEICIHPKRYIRMTFNIQLRKSPGLVI